MLNNCHYNENLGTWSLTIYAQPLQQTDFFSTDMTPGLHFRPLEFLDMIL
jgi:hypothetical protein